MDWSGKYKHRGCFGHSWIIPFICTGDNNADKMPKNVDLMNTPCSQETKKVV